MPAKLRLKPKRHKYGATACYLCPDGSLYPADKILRFHSKREAMHWLKLKQLESCGEITNLERQVAYPLMVGQCRMEMYYADFRFFDVKEGRQRVQDAKGYRTREFVRKKKWMREVWNVEIEEV